MRFAVQLPHTGPTASAKGILDGALAAERAGIDTLSVTDRVLWPVEKVDLFGEQTHPPSHLARIYEHLEVLCAVATVTERARLISAVTVTLFQPPVLLARRIAAIDQFADGRLVLGIGQGWMKEEFEVAAIPMKRRGAGFEEHVAAMRAVWGPDPVSFEGRFYRIPPSHLSPKPAQADGVPLYMGVQTEAGVQRGVRFVDGWLPVCSPATRTEDLHDHLRYLVDAARTAGREPMPTHLRAHMRLDERPLDGDRPPLVGDVEQVVDDLLVLDELGVDEVCLNQTLIGVPFDEQIEAVVRIRAALSERVGAADVPTATARRPQAS